MKTYGQKSLIDKLKERSSSDKIRFGVQNRTYYNQYGRVIPLSISLIAGLFIDKVLFYITKGLSVFIPPFSVMLMNKGYCFKEIRFEKDFGKFEFLIKHFVRK